MTATIEAKIWECLLLLTGTVRGSLPVAMPGDDYKPGDDPLISVTDVKIPPARVFIAEGQEYQWSGTLSLVLRTPVGIKLDYRRANYAASQIAARVSDASRFWFQGVCLRVTSSPSPGTAYRDGGWFHQPINIQWEAMTNARGMPTPIPPDGWLVGDPVYEED